MRSIQGSCGGGWKRSRPFHCSAESRMRAGTPVSATPRFRHRGRRRRKTGSAELFMGWNNPPVPWKEFERTLSGEPPPGDGNDSPAWARHRDGYFRPAALADLRGDDDAGSRVRVPYAELHCHSNFSFLDGASHPEELVEEAARLELDAIALTDHDGMYGVVRFAEAAKNLGVRTVFGTELSFGLSAPQNGMADPEGEHLLLLARGQDGYASLCRAITRGQLAGHDFDLPVERR